VGNRLMPRRWRRLPPVLFTGSPRKCSYYISSGRSYFDLKVRVQNKLLSELDPSMDITRTDDVRRTIQDLFEQILAEENIVYRDLSVLGFLNNCC